MNSKTSSILFTLALGSIIAVHSSCIQEPTQPNEAVLPRSIRFDPESGAYQELLSGEKDTVVFYSGVVTLAAGETGELHSTEAYEELIIALEGSGEVRLKDKGNLSISYGVIGFIPPDSYHQVLNTGQTPLKYIYIATKAR